MSATQQKWACLAMAYVATALSPWCVVYGLFFCLMGYMSEIERAAK
jgi:hypothetical protein